MPRGKIPATPGARAAGPDAVATFLAALAHPRAAEIDALRAIVRGADARIQEAIKWNAPSFFTTEHFATFRLRPGDTLQLVFHTGAKARPRSAPLHIDDPEGLLRWVAPDRCVATFGDLRDIAARRTALVAIVRQWLAQL
ncbi:MAG TPA: DUF1801 domain-containing protein [Gemmatimonadales bacterium]|nr:DUF1801 domain-containing protein [Gemmatimonadales bacterium]